MGVFSDWRHMIVITTLVPTYIFMRTVLINVHPLTHSETLMPTLLSRTSADWIYRIILKGKRLYLLMIFVLWSECHLCKI